MLVCMRLRQKLHCFVGVAQALDKYQRCLKLTVSFLGREHVDVAKTLANLVRGGDDVCARESVCGCVRKSVCMHV